MITDNLQYQCDNAVPCASDPGGGDIAARECDNTARGHYLLVNIDLVTSLQAIIALMTSWPGEY